MTKLILGTASFGKPYGVKGDPVPDEKELERIARIAWEGAIRVIHTSWQYGLPKLCGAIFSEFEWIRKDGDPRYFTWNDKRGITLYGPDEFMDLHFSDSPIANEKQAYIQIPINILDVRCLKEYGYWLSDEKAPNQDLILIARSVFLQGLLLMDKLPDWVSLDARSKISYFHGVCEGYWLQPYEAALGYVLGLDEVARVIVGVNSAKQLEQLLAVKPLKWDYDFSITDENVLDPRRWPDENDKCPIHGGYGVCLKCVKKWGQPIKEKDLKRTVESSTAVEGVHIKL